MSASSGTGSQWKTASLAGPDQQDRIEQAIASLREFGKNQALEGASIRELQNEGRR